MSFVTTDPAPTIANLPIVIPGNIVEFADAETLLKSPVHPYTQALISAIPVPDPKKIEILGNGTVLSGLGYAILRIGVAAKEFWWIFALFAGCHILKEAIGPLGMAIVGLEGLQGFPIGCAFLLPGKAELGQGTGGASQLGNAAPRVSPKNRALPSWCPQPLK